VKPVSWQVLSRLSNRAWVRVFSRRRILTFVTALIIAVAALSTAFYVYFLPKDNIASPLTFRKVLDTGSVFVQQYRDFRTEYFVINGSEWYIKWKDWNPSIPEGTQLEIVVRDAYSNHGQGLRWIDMNGTDNFRIKGVFYLTISVWPYSRTFSTRIPHSFNATIEVWRAEA
jgi:hypothetical protein